MKKFLLYIIIFTIFTFLKISVAQHSVNTLLNDVIMPSPSVSTMNKFTEVNTTLSRGTIDISIPIHVVNSGSLSLPIVLSYNTSGIKANEISDWVGSGWNLSSGGMVARTVQGIPDDIENGFWETHSHLYTCNNTETPHSYHGRTVAAGIINGIFDGEPDLFTFNLPGYYGKFYFDFINGIKTPVLIDQQDVLIEEIFDNSKPIREKLRGFKIITPNGNVFWFGEKDGRTAIDRIHANGQHFYAQSWQLIKIESADSKYSIDLDYTLDIFRYHSKGTETKRYYSCGSGLAILPSSVIYNFYAEYENIIRGNKISKITTNYLEINFNSSQDREDTYPENGTLGRKLNRIEIRTGLSPNSYCKNFNFSYDYFKSSPNANSANDKKLKLNSVQESSCNNLTNNSPYIFEYNGSFCPNLLTKAVDHWGYYNGASQNGVGANNFPLTTLNIGPNCSGLPTTITVGGANRETNEAEMVKGTLKKIVYPTGGFAEYTWEANEICGPLNITDNENEEYLLNRTNCEEVSLVSTILNSSIFTGTNRKFIRIKIEECSNSNILKESNPYFVLGLLDSDSVEIDRTDIFYEGHEWSKEFKLDELFGSIKENQLFRIKLLSPYEYCSEFNPNVILSAVNEVYDPINEANRSTNTKVGGLRIKTMVLHDGISSNNNIIRNYSYQNDFGCSSGSLAKHPKYLHVEGFSPSAVYLVYGGTCGFVGTTCAPTSVTKFLLQDQSIVPLSGFDGYHILYTRAQEYIGENPVTVTEYEFEPADLISYDPNIYPYLSGQSLITGGKEKKIIKIGDNCIPEIYEVTDKISTSVISQRKYFKASWDVIYYSSVACGPGLNSTYIGNNWKVRGYSIRSGNYKIKERKFVKGIVTTECFEYSSSNHHFPTASYTKNSDEKIFRTEFTYNTDYPNTDLRNALIAKNIILSPWKTIQKAGGNQGNGFDGSIIDGTEIEYAFFNNLTGSYQTSNTGGFARPFKFYRYERTWDLNNQLTGSGKQLIGTISNYDLIGRPKTYTKTGWLPEIYEWTLDGQMKKRTFKNFISQFNYIPGSFLLESAVDIDGQVTYYEYDQLFRLKKIKRRNNNVVTDYEYNFKSISIPYNFIITKTTYTPVTGSQLHTVEDIEYFDGLGRPIQINLSKSSSAQKDVIQIYSYDNLGHLNQNFVPFEANQSNGTFLPTIPINTNFTQYEYEYLLNGRILSSTPPGWYPTLYNYNTNSSADLVRLDLSISNSYYPAGSLSRKLVTDPNGNKEIEFIDKFGRLVLSRKSNNSGTEITDTYYQYDDKNRLVKIIPHGISIFDVNNIITYTYDEKDNISSKRIPGKGLERMIYNSRGLITFYQEPSISSQGKWMMYKYNDYGQEIQFGFWNGTSPNAENSSTPFSELLKENIYDDITTIYKGRLKQEKVKILDGSPTPNWLNQNYSYDSYGRVSNINANNHLNLTLGSEIQSFIYDFKDNIISTIRTHKKDAGTTLVVTSRFTFDHRGRELNKFIKLNSQQEVHLSSVVYDPRNLIIEKKLGGNSSGTMFLQNINYSYNDQGWLTAINETQVGSDLLSIRLWYDQSQYILHAIPQKNGNISHMKWRIGTGKYHYYGFSYDYLNRMTLAKYAEESIGLSNFDRYNESISYDARGNILTFNRNGLISSGNFGIIDQLSYTYHTIHKNRISNIAETGNFARGFKTTSVNGAYMYNNNGSLAVDLHKKVTYSYFHGNIIKRASFHNGNQIDWIYDANGNKLSKVTNAPFNNTKHYCNGIEYSGTGSTFNLEAIYHSEGRVTPMSSNTWRYEYSLKDHLGNVRVTFADLNNNGSITTSEILQENHFYPFGGNIEGLSSTSQPNKYQFSNKENNEDFGLNLNDFHFRWYDPWIGRFIHVDPKAAEMPEWSPYSFSFNNPLVFIDPDGQKPIPVTSRQFIQFANSVGIYGNQQIGSYFERLSIASLQTTRPVMHNTTQDFFSPARQRMNGGLPASVRPDGISAYLGASSRGETFISPSFYEAKATSATLTKRYRKGQITGMIDALANMDRRPNEMASLTLVTTADTKISADILEYATSRRVVVFQSVAALDDETGEFILSEKTLLNGNGISTLIDQLRKLNGRYDEFNGVNPLNYLNGNNPGPGDPDPATIEDR